MSTIQTGETKQLRILVAISQTLAGTLNLTVALQQVLELLERHHGMLPSRATLLDKPDGALIIAAAHGLTNAGRRIRYHVGEGITGRVVESGKPIIVPRVSHEPMFLHRAGRRNLNKQERTCICVPVVINRKPVGA